MPELSPAQIHREQRWSSTVWIEADNFGAGAFPDVAPHLIPEGGVYDAVDMLCDKRGVLRKRGGTTSDGTTATTCFATLFGRLANAYAGTTLYGARPNGNAYTIIADGNVSMGGIGLTSAGGIGSNAGRPFEHLGFMLFPNQQPGSASGTISAGGNQSVSSVTFATPGSATITAGDPTVTTAAGDTAVSSPNHVGMMVSITGAANSYVGRVESVTGAHSFTVFPRPTVTFTPTAASLSAFYTGLYGFSLGRTVGGKVGCSHQGRILLGNVVRTTFGKAPEAFPYRVWYSLLPDETPESPSGQTGAIYLTGDGFENNNYFDVPSLEPIVALVPFGEGQVLILGPTKAHRLTGQLLTQTSVRAGITYDVHPIPGSVGCLSEASVQTSERGVIWASAEGVYLSDGASVRPLMDGSVAELWRDGFHSGGAQVVGSALIRNHYLVCTNGYHYLCNLSTLAWTKLSGAGARVFYGAANATDTTKVYGLLFGTPGVTSFAKGSLARLDSMFAPTSTNKNDIDGTAVSGVVVTRSYSAGGAMQVKNFTRAQIQYDARSGTPTVSRTVVSPADGVWTSLGSLPATTARTDYTFGMGAASVQRGYSAAYQIATGSCDSFELYGIKTAFQSDKQGAS